MRSLHRAAWSQTNFAVAVVDDSRTIDARWDDFVNSSERASIYHLVSWREVIKKLFGHKTYYLYAESAAGDVIGILPLIRLKSYLFGDYLVSLPYFNYGGAIGNDPTVEEALMLRACELAWEIGTKHIEFRDTVGRGKQWTVRTDKVTMSMRLPGSSDELWARIGSKVRAQVKRPLREGATVIHGGMELLDDFYKVFSRNMRDLGTPVYPRKFFAEILRAFSKSSHITVVRHENRPVAAGVLLGFRGRMEIPWASSLREANSIGVNMLLYWEVLKRTIEMGYRSFDFGRSTIDSGTYRFKKQWGAEPNQLYWHYWLREGSEIPQINPDNPKYRLAISAWQRMPVGIANWLGPYLVKSLP